MTYFPYQEARAMVEGLRHGMAESLAAQGLGRAREFLTPGRLLYFEKFKISLDLKVRYWLMQAVMLFTIM